MTRVGGASGTGLGRGTAAGWPRRTGPRLARSCGDLRERSGADHRRLWAWTGFNSALRGAEPRGVGLVVPFSDVIVFRTASLGTWTIFLRARCCDTLPTCHATVYGDF